MSWTFKSMDIAIGVPEECCFWQVMTLGAEGKSKVHGNLNLTLVPPGVLEMQVWTLCAQPSLRQVQPTP
jgi:hypothetical protein